MRIYKITGEDGTALEIPYRQWSKPQTAKEIVEEELGWLASFNQAIQEGRENWAKIKTKEQMDAYIKANDEWWDKNLDDQQ